MKVLILFLVSVGLYLLLPNVKDNAPAVKTGGKAYVRVEAHNVGDPVKIHSSYLSLLTLQQLFTKEYEIAVDSTFLLTFDNGIPTEYNLSLGKDVSIPIFVIPGDTLTIKVDYHQNRAAPSITYEGLTSEINRYLHDKPEHIAFSTEAANFLIAPLT